MRKDQENRIRELNFHGAASQRRCVASTHERPAFGRRTSIPEAIAPRVFGIAPFEQQPGFFVAFLVKIMEEVGVSVGRKAPSQIIQAHEKREQVGLGHRRGHRSDGVLEFHEGLQNRVLELIHTGKLTQ
jgi:hypothetical protein